MARTKNTKPTSYSKSVFKCGSSILTTSSKETTTISRSRINCRPLPTSSIPRLAFQKLIRDLAHRICPGFRFQSAALGALQEASETYLAQLFSDALECALHAHRLTVTAKDINLARRLRGELQDEFPLEVSSQSFHS